MARLGFGQEGLNKAVPSPLPTQTGQDGKCQQFRLSGNRAPHQKGT